MDRSVRVVYKEEPRAVRLLSNNFRTQSLRIRFGARFRQAMDYPVAVKNRKTARRLNDRTRCQPHLNSNRKQGMKRGSNILATYYRLSAQNQDGFTFVAPASPSATPVLMRRPDFIGLQR